MSQINVTVIGSTAECSLVSNCDTVNVTFADQSGGAGTGTAATIEVGSVVTVTATESASVVNSGTGYAAKLDFKIPRGASAGLSLGTVTSGTAAAAAITGTAPSQVLSLTLPPGPPNSLSIGTVTGGTAAAASITGAAPSQVLSLTLPAGEAGPQGSSGPSGPPNSLSIGTVTGGTAAAASITGSAPSQVLSLVLPVGATGPAGPQGATGPAGPPINLGDETPQPLGTASAGTALTAARADHIHAVPTIAYSSLAGVPSNFPSNIASVSGLQAALDGKQAAGNYATLVGGTVPSSQLPSFVDDCLEYAALSGFPATGEVGKIYVARDTNKTYRWSGSTYVEISASPGSTDAVPEGSTNLYHTTKRAADAAPVQSVAGRTGAVTLTSADVSGVVSGVNNLTGNLTLAAGSNITITPSGSTLTISGAAAGIGANDAVDGGDYVGELLYGITFTKQPQSQTVSSSLTASLSAASVSANQPSTSVFSANSRLYSPRKYDGGAAIVSSQDNGSTWQALPSPGLTLANTYSLTRGDVALLTSNGTRTLFRYSSWDGTNDHYGALHFSDSADLSSATAVTGDAASASLIVWNGSRFIAATANNSRWNIFSSSDGASWTIRISVEAGTLAFDVRWMAVLGSAVFVGQGSNAGDIFAGHPAGGVMRSDDGISWSTVAVSGTKPLSVASSGTRLVGVNETTARWTLDGTVWNTSTLPMSCDRISYAAGVFWAFRSSQQTTDVCYSADGSQWTLGTLPASRKWLSAASSGGAPFFLADDGYATATISTVPASANLTVSATAASGNPVSYQWQTSLDAGTSWANVANATNTTLNLTGLTQADNGTRYRVLANATGATPAASQSAILTVTG